MDGLSGIMTRLAEVSAIIGPLEKSAREELERMDDKTFWRRVCHNIIADTLEEVPPAAFLYECAYRNREVFNDRNSPHSYLIAKDPARPSRDVELQPEIKVNIAQVARFSMTCPYAGTERCHLRNFRFAASDEEDSERESMLERGRKERTRAGKVSWPEEGQ